MSKRKRKQPSEAVFLWHGFLLSIMGLVTVTAVELTNPTPQTGQRLVKPVQVAEVSETKPVVLYRVESAYSDWVADLERSLAMICKEKKCIRNKQGQLVLAEAKR